MSYYFYEVKSGDQLYQILKDHYGSSRFLGDKSAILSIIKSNNPSITNIDLIRPGQIIMLPEINSAPTGLSRGAGDVAACEIISSRLSKYDSQTLGALSGLKLGEIASSGSESFISAVEKITKDTIPDMKRVALSYYQKEAGTISRNQYDYRRKISVANVDQRLGALHQLINPGRKPREVLRISPRSTMRTENILKEIDQLARISKVAKYGGVVLSVASLGVTLTEIHTAESNEERTTIVLDSVAGILGGAIAIAVVGTPVGLAGVAILVVAGAGGSLVGQTLGDHIQRKTLYDSKGNRITTSLDKLWSAVYK